MLHHFTMVHTKLCFAPARRFTTLHQCINLLWFAAELWCYVSPPRTRVHQASLVCTSTLVLRVTTLQWCAPSFSALHQRSGITLHHFLLAHACQASLLCTGMLGGTSDVTEHLGSMASEILLTIVSLPSLVLSKIPRFQSLFLMKFERCILECIFRKTFGVFLELFPYNPEFSEILNLNLLYL